MVVYADKHFMKCDDFPDTDFIGDADYVLDDEIDAELENKIIDLYPNFDFVFGNDGKPVDVTPTVPDPAPPEINTEQRLTAMENAVEEIINILMEV